MSTGTAGADDAPTCPRCGTELEPYGDDGAECPNDDCRWVQTRGFEGPALDGRMSSGPWANDGETVDGTPREDTGEITTDDWPSSVPEDPFIDDRYDHESDKHKIVRTLALNPDASSEEIADIVGCGEQWVDKTRSIISVFAEPEDVEFDIPELPWDVKKTNDHLDHPQSRFESAEDLVELRHGHGDRVDDPADTTADQNDTTSSDSLQQSSESGVTPSEEQSDESGVSEQTLEVLGRKEILGQDKSTIIEEMGISEDVVNGSKSAARFADESQYIVPDDAEGSERRATVESEVDDPEVMENEDGDAGGELDPETAHTTPDEPSDSTAWDDELTDAFLGGAVAVILLWIGYRIGRWRAGGERE